jgi:hypothetical protein
MNHDTLGLVVKFILRARKVTGPIEATRLAEDISYREEIFNKIAAEGDVELNEMALNLRNKIEQNESVASSSTYKDIPIDFNYYKNAARS